MKKRYVYFILIQILFFSFVKAQEISIYNDYVEWDDKPLILQGLAGIDSKEKYVTIRNFSNFVIEIHVHTHSSLDFIWFKNSKGDEGTKINFLLDPYGEYYLKVHTYLSEGLTKIYNDDLGFDIIYKNQDLQTIASAYIEMDLVAYIYNIDIEKYPPNISKPSGYDLWRTENGRLRRVETLNFPLTVYSNHSLYIKSDIFDKAVRRSISIWNVAGQSVGINNIYQLRSSPNNADFTIDWSGKDLSSNTLGIATMTKGNPSYIVGIVMKKPTINNLGRTCETLCQELGHLLGIKHSDNQNDIMNGTAHKHWHNNLSEVDMTDRDRQMLKWLYSQAEFVPIRSKIK